MRKRPGAGKAWIGCRSAGYVQTVGAASELGLVVPLQSLKAAPRREERSSSSIMVGRSSRLIRCAAIQ